MKIRNGFVSNSSSTAFLITNKSRVTLHLGDFVRENPQLVQEYNMRYGRCEDQESLLDSAIQENIVFAPGEVKECIFGDEDGTIVGRIFDYILRDGGESENFEWSFKEFYR